MEKSKVKEKSFIEKNKTKIVVGGIVIGLIAYKMHIRNIRRQAFLHGVGAGFQSTMDWFDTNFDNLNLRGLWNVWSKAKYGNIQKENTKNNIISVYSIDNTNYGMFQKDLINAINLLQDDGQKVEVQYQVNSFPNGQIVSSALILGRK